MMILTLTLIIATSLSQLGDKLEIIALKKDNHNLWKDGYMNKYVMIGALAMTMGITGIAQADEHKGKDFEKFQHKMFEKMDTDGNGSISRDEFMAVHEEKFTMMDTNGDGELSMDELKASREKMKEKYKSMRKEKKDRKMIDSAPVEAE